MTYTFCKACKKDTKVALEKNGECRVCLLLNSQGRSRRINRSNALNDLVGEMARRLSELRGDVA